MTEDIVTSDDLPTEKFVTSGNYRFKIVEHEDGNYYVFSLQGKREDFEFDEVSFERAQELAIRTGEFWTLCDDAERPFWQAIQNHWKSFKSDADGFDKYVFRVLKSIEDKVRAKAGRDLDSLLEEE